MSERWFFMSPIVFLFFFFNDTATTEIYTLSLHDALPISPSRIETALRMCCRLTPPRRNRSEEHTSELQSRRDLVCRLLLEKKKKQKEKQYKIKKKQRTEKN